MTRRPIPPGPAAVLIAALLFPLAPRAAGAGNPDPSAGERWFAQPASPARDRAIRKWASDAALPDLIYALRRPSAALGELEAPLLERALKRVPEDRGALARQLTLRLAAADPRHAGRWVGKLAGEVKPLAARAPASPFRVAALLPEQGDYEDYARALMTGLEAGFAGDSAGAGRAIELVRWGTGSDDPARAAAAFDSASASAATIVGELLSVPTLAVASAARVAGVPLISPTATDESIGTVGRTIFQIGPSAWERGAALARALLDPGHPARVGMLLSSEAEARGLARGFAAAVESLGSRVVWRDGYAPGTVNFAEFSRALLEKHVEVLFWDGESSEAEALLRRLAQDRVSIRLGGGEDLAPERFHAEVRGLLDGVRFVGDDWRLDPAARAELDRRAGDGPDPPSPSLVARGYLTARFITEAVRGGALCPEEIAAALARRLSPEPWPRAHRFLDCAALGAHIPVMTVTRGRAVPDQ